MKYHGFVASVLCSHGLISLFATNIRHISQSQNIEFVLHGNKMRCSTMQFVSWKSTVSNMKPAILVLVLVALASPAFAGFGYKVYVKMTDGNWASMGKMDTTFHYSPNYQPKFTLQPHMEKIEAGKIYSGMIEAPINVTQLMGVDIHWRRKTFGAIFNRRSILVDHVIVEPVYLLGPQRDAWTRKWCTYTRQSTEIKPDDRAYFGYQC